MNNFALNRSHNWDFQQSIGALVKGTEVLYWAFVLGFCTEVLLKLVWSSENKLFDIYCFLCRCWKQRSFNLRGDCESSQVICLVSLFWNQNLKLTVLLDSLMRTGGKQWEYVQYFTVKGGKIWKRSLLWLNELLT